jgi:hypothetical protein
MGIRQADLFIFFNPKSHCLDSGMVERVLCYPIFRDEIAGGPAHCNLAEDIDGGTLF